MSQIAASAILIATKTMKVYKNDWFSKILGIDEKESCNKILVNANYGKKLAVVNVSKNIRMQKCASFD